MTDMTDMSNSTPICWNIINCHELRFISKGMAMAVAHKANDIVRLYGQIARRDLLDLACISSSDRDNKRGWRSPTIFNVVEYPQIKTFRLAASTLEVVFDRKGGN